MFKKCYNASTLQNHQVYVMHDLYSDLPSQWARIALQAFASEYIQYSLFSMLFPSLALISPQDSAGSSGMEPSGAA